MRAHVQPLNGKHYGTHIDIDDGDRKFSITLWVPFGRPSSEECGEWGITPDEWDRNVMIDGGWDTVRVPIQSEFPCDSHYQSEYERKIADRIAWALNGWEP